MVCVFVGGEGSICVDRGKRSVGRPIPTPAAFVCRRSSPTGRHFQIAFIACTSLTTYPFAALSKTHNNKQKYQFQVWDLGGQTSIRPYWRCYYPNTDAIIFVVDSADTERMPIARGELAAMLEEEELRESILLVFANKQDQKGALNAQQVSDALALPEVRNRQWSIQETSALQGKGLFEGFDWLVTCIKGDEGAS